MTEHRKWDFCTGCRRETEYMFQKKNIIKTVRDKEYTFQITVAVCKNCGSEMSVPGLLDLNIQEIDAQYRAIEHIVTTADICKLMKLYQLGKAPLSLALGFGEVTVSRYLEGQIPSREYSDMIRSALISPAYMKEQLKEHRSKLTDTAYKKAIAAAEKLEKLFSISEKMRNVIAYLFKKMEEITPLMLQKLLYFIQGIHLALYKAPVFAEDCRAWIHGPVYPEVYNLFRDFKYNPIDDARFAMLENAEDSLNADEKEVIDLVVNTFGRYSGKILEKITHSELPWQKAREGYDDSIPSNEILPKNIMKEYYESIRQNYDLSPDPGLMKYIHDKIQ